jgi:crossover junction endodeoxyribonuclease RuvC
MPSAPAPQRILGIDPSLRGTGFGVIEASAHGKSRLLECGTIRNPSDLSIGGCLLAIHDRLVELILQWHPDVAAIESTIFVQSRSSAISLGCARGAALMAVARHGIALAEYSPKAIKSSATGFGAAGKGQVAFMVRTVLGLDYTPASDAADALATALTHLQRGGAHGQLTALRRPSRKATARAWLSKATRHSPRP